MNDRVKHRITLNSWIWPGLVITLALLQLAFPYRGWLMLLVGLGGAWGIGLYWVHRLKAGLRMKREMRYGWAQVGDILEERFELTNDTWLPVIWVEVADHSNIPGYKVSQATGVEANSSNAWKTQQTCSQRGLFTLGPTTLSTGDPFGIYSLWIEDPASATLLVTPPVLPLPSIQVASGGRAGEGRTARGGIEQTVRLSGTRDYLPGDSMRRIHWPTTARQNKLFVKTFESAPASDWWIILDLEDRIQIGHGMRSTEETGVVLAASLADRGIKNGIGVGLVASSQDPVWIPPRQGDHQRWEILQTLARMHPGSLPLEQVLERTQPTIRYQSSLILITPAVDARWVEPLMTLVHRGVVPTVLLLDPVSFGGSERAEKLLAVLSDLEIASYSITPDLLEQSKPMGDLGNAWEWRVLPTGKAVPIHKPGDFSWKSLS
jgi:uncharacterized protein (DUF58 family)